MTEDEDAKPVRQTTMNRVRVLRENRMEMDCVEINTDASNQNSLEPKPSGLGLAQIVSNVIHIRN
ncbi:hypothetical protein MTR_4g116023 [Medicago truncatula]|uniref:Uncharacterized protein n=1 Tax=Medicago truncatula TaxID=3880 RepID=A0A072V1Z5_MEDTR|nr:hypothetical protein MTR_4g116023 [Medicago truncatula]